MFKIIYLDVTEYAVSLIKAATYSVISHAMGFNDLDISENIKAEKEKQNPKNVFAVIMQPFQLL